MPDAGSPDPSEIIFQFTARVPLKIPPAALAMATEAIRLAHPDPASIPHRLALHNLRMNYSATASVSVRRDGGVVWELPRVIPWPERIYDQPWPGEGLWPAWGDIG